MNAVAIARFFTDVRREYVRHTERHGRFTSAHEGWAVIYEEVEELWEEVRKKRRNRDLENAYHECVQIAAMALKFAVCVCLPAE